MCVASSGFRGVLQFVLKSGGELPTDPAFTTVLEYAKDFELG